MRRFEGKVAVVTGAAGGIGRAAAQRFAAEGASLVLVDLEGASIEETVAVVEHVGGKVCVVHADVALADQVRAYVQAARETFGGVDVFFNNAGISGPAADLFNCPEDAFARVLEVNVKGVWLGMREIAPTMIERGGGAIVNTASIAGLAGAPTLFAYGASKHAVVGMTKSAALTLASRGVRVNAICPGFVDTPMVDELARDVNPDDWQAAKDRLGKRSPLGRIGRPQEIAALVAYLCSDEASFTTGGIYPIDGGNQAS